MSDQAFVIEEVHDLDAVWPEIEALFDGLHRYHEPWFGLHRAPDWPARQRAGVEADSGLILIARANGEAIGFMTARIRQHHLIDTCYGYVDDAYIVDEWRQHGVGRALLAHVEAWAAAQGADDLNLNVAAGNEAGIAAWQALGFETFLHSMGKRISEVTRG